METQGAVAEKAKAGRSANLSAGSDFIEIRGRRLDIDNLVDSRIDSPEFVESCRAAYVSAKPFVHLAVDGLFNPDLLELVVEEFPGHDASMNAFEETNFSVLRSAGRTRMGHATQVYYNVANSDRVVRFLEGVTGVDDLIADQTLRYGGLHDTPNGGHFGVHRDFNHHPRTMLKNEMAFITYLNKDWQPSYLGDLQLWDATTRKCIDRVAPLFGRSLILKHALTSFHGHPEPLNFPEGQSRKSVLSYYYTNAEVLMQKKLYRGSLFLNDVAEGSAVPDFGKSDPRINADVRRKLKNLARECTPPIVWTAALRILNRKPGLDWD